MARSNRAKTAGGYSADDIESGADDHSDGRSELYELHQRLQAEFRAAELRRNLAHFLAREEHYYGKLLEPVEQVLNSVVQDRLGNLLSMEQGSEIRATAATRRLYYLCEDGRWDRLRERAVVRDQNGRTKKDAKGRPIRKEVPPEKVKVVFHDSYQLNPVLALAVMFAARDGAESLKLALHFLRLGGKDMIEIFESVAGAEILLAPYHSKALGGHYQPDYALVSETGRKLAVRRMKHLGKSLIGAWRWVEMGYTGENLDRLTGVPGSEDGLKKILDFRGKRSVDFNVCSKLDQRMWKRLDEPEFALLKTIVLTRAKPEYEAYLKRRMQAVSGETPKRRIAKLSALLMAERQRVLAREAELITTKEELDKLKQKLREHGEDAAVQLTRFEQTLGAKNEELRAREALVAEQTSDIKRLSDSLVSAKNESSQAAQRITSLTNQVRGLEGMRDDLAGKLADAEKKVELSDAEAGRLHVIVTTLESERASVVAAARAEGHSEAIEDASLIGLLSRREDLLVALQKGYEPDERLATELGFRRRLDKKWVFNTSLKINVPTKNGLPRANAFLAVAKRWADEQPRPALRKQNSQDFADRELETLGCALQCLRRAQRRELVIDASAASLMGGLVEVADVPGGWRLSQSWQSRLDAVAPVVGKEANVNLREEAAYSRRVAGYTVEDFTAAARILASDCQGKSTPASDRYFNPEGSVRPELLEAANVAIAEPSSFLPPTAEVIRRAKRALEFTEALDSWEIEKMPILQGQKATKQVDI